jgi:type IV pilus assembly protein PilA
MIPKKHGKQGFSLIELLTVLAIVGVLAAIAIPTYMGQTVNAKLIEVTNALSYVASALTLYHHEAVQTGATNVWPNCGCTAEIQTSLGVGIPAGRISAASVTQSTGVISFTVANIDSAVNGSTITLTPSSSVTDSTVSWKWGGTLPPRYLPKE